MKLSDIFHNIHDYFTEKRFVIFILTIIFSLSLLILILSDGFAGGSDSIAHYLFSHNALKFPQLFFDNWAKPIFTLLSAPFALFGFKGIQFFNILAAITAGYFTYLVAKELKMKQPILAIILCCFTPVFAYNIFSGLTEILFALASIVITYLLLKNKYIFAAIILSFLPLIRTEGIFLIPIYGIFLISKKQYKALLFILTGTLVYSIIGSFFNKDIFWLFTQTPYKLEIGVFGTGSFFQYIQRSPGFFGIPNEIFYVTGLAAGITLYLRNKKEYSKEFLLVVLPFLTYFFAHSFMWWSGIGNSMGTNRYMAAIVPFMAVMSTRGLTLFSLLFEIIFKKSWVKTAALYIGIISVIHLPFVVQNYPIPLDKISKFIGQTTDWLKAEKLDNNKIYYNDVAFPYFLGIDPLNKIQTHVFLADPKKPYQNIEAGSILIYDERYSPVAQINFDSLVQNHHFELQKVFEPDNGLRAFGKDYKIAIFKRIEPDSTVLSQNRIIAYGSKDEFRSLIQLDFEKQLSSTDSTLLFYDNKSETKCLKIEATTSQFLYKEFDLSTISFEKPLELYIRLKINPQDTLKQPLLYSISVEKNDKKFYSNEISLVPEEFKLNSWSNLEYRIKLTEDISFKGILKLYLLNRNKGEYLIDDYQVGYCHKR